MLLSIKALSVLASMRAELANDNWSPTTPAGELDILCDLLVRYKCKHVLELGTHLGYTAIVMADICGSVTTVDPRYELQAIGRKYAEIASLNVDFVGGYSLQDFIIGRAEGFDAVYLDTSHDYASTVKEIAAYAPRTPMLLLHDCSVNETKYDLDHVGGVRKAFYEWLAEHTDYRGMIYEPPDYPEAVHGLGVLWRPWS